MPTQASSHRSYTLFSLDFRIWEAAFSYFLHFHERNHALTNTVAHLIDKTKICSHKLSEGKESGVLNSLKRLPAVPGTQMHMFM